MFNNIEHENYKLTSSKKWQNISMNKKMIKNNSLDLDFFLLISLKFIYFSGFCSSDESEN